MTIKSKYVVENVILSDKKNMKVKSNQQYNEENQKIKLDLSFRLLEKH